MKKIRHIFLRGFFTLLPIVGTVYLIYFLFKQLDGFMGLFIEWLAGRSLPGVGIVASILLIFASGFLMSNIIGQKLLHYAEKLLQNIPVVPKVYFGIKQIIDAFSVNGKQVFNKVVLIEYPRKGIFAIGFQTGECRGEVQEKTAAKVINVFVPTTPNPTSGMLLLIPEEEIIYLDMSVEEGLKLIVSAGMVVPDELPKAEEP
ncbi:DUF502 domain-containing protein [Youngiibacter multivorans]|uniref:Membrane protein n=1 Tax=Youngiibacter multivorans TaxID=937251 RepID=A0ABS4G5V8_9CLOT|nr:DUF502 domain-containing protein [Youngiibacter multivorans]MBP1919960.1 putative membrane protein [Youngiibacter multivorans]